MVKKHQILGLALFAIFAFSAVITATALAAEESLPAQWLFNGSAVTAALPTLSTGSLLLEDTKTSIGKVAVVCNGKLDGEVNTAGKDKITAVLNSAGTEIVLGGTALLCANETNCGGEAEVFPELLPWNTQLNLLEPSGKFVDALTSEAGYNVTCTILGLKVVDECTAAIGTTTKVENGTSDVVETPGLAEPNGTCSLGGAGAGVIQVVEALIEDTTAGTLAASE